MIHEVQNDLIIKDKDIKEKLSKIDDFIESVHDSKNKMKQAKNVEEGGREDSEVDIVNSYDIIIDNYLISNQSEKQYLEEENSQSNNKQKIYFKDMLINMVETPNINLDSWNDEFNKLLSGIYLRK